MLTPLGQYSQGLGLSGNPSVTVEDSGRFHPWIHPNWIHPSLILRLSNGGTLRTCVLRANTVYGEKAAFLQELYLLTRARNGVLNYLEPEDTERNHTYVGE